VSHSCACIRSPCLRQCVHGASIGGVAAGLGGLLDAAAAVQAPAPAVADSAGGGLGMFDFAAMAPPPTATDAPTTTGAAEAEPAGSLLGTLDFDNMAAAPAVVEAAPAAAAEEEAPVPAVGVVAAPVASFGRPEAEALLAQIGSLEAELEGAMAAEDFDRCDALNRQVEELSQRKEEAQALCAA
jgi:hypothetical protein